MVLNLTFVSNLETARTLHLSNYLGLARFRVFNIEHLVGRYDFEIEHDKSRPNFITAKMDDFYTVGTLLPYRELIPYLTRIKPDLIIWYLFNHLNPLDTNNLFGENGNLFKLMAYHPVFKNTFFVNRDSRVTSLGQTYNLEDKIFDFSKPGGITLLLNSIYEQLPGDIIPSKIYRDSYLQIGDSSQPGSALTHNKFDIFGPYKGYYYISSPNGVHRVRSVYGELAQILFENTRITLNDLILKLDHINRPNAQKTFTIEMNNLINLIAPQGGIFYGYYRDNEDIDRVWIVGNPYEYAQWQHLSKDVEWDPRYGFVKTGEKYMHLKIRSARLIDTFLANPGKVLDNRELMRNSDMRYLGKLIGELQTALHPLGLIHYVNFPKKGYVLSQVPPKSQALTTLKPISNILDKPSFSVQESSDGLYQITTPHENVTVKKTLAQIANALFYHGLMTQNMLGQEMQHINWSNRIKLLTDTTNRLVARIDPNNEYIYYGYLKNDEQFEKVWIMGNPYDYASWQHITDHLSWDPRFGFIKIEYDDVFYRNLTLAELGLFEKLVKHKEEVLGPDELIPGSGKNYVSRAIGNLRKKLSPLDLIQTVTSPKKGYLLK